MAHKMLTASLMVACLATSSLITSSAVAKDAEMYFYPKNKWKIEAINDKSCVIKNQLNNGYKIEIAGTASGFTNINIDFRQNSFKTDEEYEVTYGIPSILEKEISAKAFKPNLLVSDLREEKEFANALSEASVLDVKIKNTEFRVYMTGFLSKIAEYNDCLLPENSKISTLDVPKQPKEVEGDVAPLPPLKMSSYSQDDNINTVEKISENSLRPEASNSDRYTQELDRQMKEESEKYKADPVAEELDLAVEAVAVKNSENNEPDKNVTSEHLESEKVKYNVVKSKPISVDFTKVAQEINPESGNSDSSVHMRDKIIDLEKQIESLKAKNSTLDDELKSTLHDARDEKLSVSSENWNLELATMKFNESERQVMRLGRQLQTHKSQCQQEKAKLENMLFDPTLTSQQQLSDLASLEAELDKVKSDMYRQQRQYEERIKLLEGQLSSQ